GIRDFHVTGVQTCALPIYCFIEIAPSPRAKESDTRLVQPDENKFAGFVFKIHANMDPKHRDRLAFIKIVSGTFERNKPYMHVRRSEERRVGKECRSRRTW